MSRTDPLADLFHTLARDGFAHVPGARMRALFEAAGPLERDEVACAPPSRSSSLCDRVIQTSGDSASGHHALADAEAFAASWNDLGLDTYMADGGRYRRRRFGVFAAPAGSGPIARAPHQPHYQSRDYNPLNGGIERWFAPISPDVGAGATMVAILATCRSLFDRLAPGKAWHIEVHQFRIEARAGEAGKPTPEGMHRDGVDWVLVLLVRRENIRSGVTSIHAPDGRTLGSFTLGEPFAAALVDDHRVLHGVTPVEPEDASRPAFRDVLVVTFRAASG